MSIQSELLTAPLRDERGFTLVEVLVALAVGAIVSTATLAIVIVSVHFSSNYTDRIDSDQQGRLAMQQITQALNSSCVSPTVAPILAGSTGSSIMFYSAHGDAPGLTPSQLTVALSGTAPAPLVMTTQALQGTAPNWTTLNSPTTVTLASYAGQTGSVPLFQYYAYGSNGVISTTPDVVGSGGLTAAQALAAAQVTITYQVLPSDKWASNNRGADFSDSVVFRLTPSSSASTATNEPCT
jgi:prepilin-type N-terminal cleavage/methylation domain-containing protein